MAQPVVDVPMMLTLEPPFAANVRLPGTLQYPSNDSNPKEINVSSVPNYQQALETFPTVVGGHHSLFFAEHDIPAFLQHNLDLSRLNRIHGGLWLAGRPVQARPLHRYRLLDYEILGTQQMDLHLAWDRGSPHQLMVKSLSYWLLSHEFWSKHICWAKDLWMSTSGLLRSYVWLVRTPLELEIAHHLALLPKSITWDRRRLFVKSFMDHVDINICLQVNERYQYGELRLDRINSIYRYRYWRTHAVQGYLSGYRRHTPLLERKFAWALIPFGVFLTVILSAMQVGIGLPVLASNKTFLEASYRIVLSSMCCVLVLVSTVTVAQLLLFGMNIVSAFNWTRHVLEKRTWDERVKGGDMNV